LISIAFKGRYDNKGVIIAEVSDPISKSVAQVYVDYVSELIGLKDSLLINTSG
jgi:hypothetical protein